MIVYLIDDQRIGLSAVIGVAKHWKSMKSLKIVADTPLRQLNLTQTLALTLILNHTSFCTNTAPLATRNKRTANDAW